MRKVTYTILFAAALLFAGAAVLAEGDTMKVPPIDLNQPAQIETATFALG